MLYGTRSWAGALCLLLLLASSAFSAPADLAEMKPEQFLAELRRPFRQDAWGDITGRLIHVAGGKRQKGTVRIRLTFSPSSMHAQVTVNEKNTYGYEQRHGKGDVPETTLDLPEKEEPPGLADFGVQPEDVTFAFIYWKLVRELPKTSFRRRECRVFELRHPEDGKGTVQVWFDASRGFPLQAKWFRAKEDKPWRTLELKGAKKHAADLWFVKEMRLEGADWKTQVKFDHAEINPMEKAAPGPALPEAKERSEKAEK
jgi:hypothetical protein